MFKSNEFSWSDIQIYMSGKIVAGVTSISYTESQEKNNIYAKGNKPHSRGHGNKTYEGEISLLQSEVEALQSQLGPNQSILDLRNVTIVISYAPANGVPVSDSCKHVEFNEIPKGMNQGDGNMEVTASISIGDIKRNI
jgi:hypothetical protein